MRVHAVLANPRAAAHAHADLTPFAIALASPSVCLHFSGCCDEGSHESSEIFYPRGDVSRPMASRAFVLALTFATTLLTRWLLSSPSHPY